MAGALSWAVSDTDRGVTCGRRLWASSAPRGVPTDRPPPRAEYVSEPVSGRMTGPRVRPGCFAAQLRIRHRQVALCQVAEVASNLPTHLEVVPTGVREHGHRDRQRSGRPLGLMGAMD